MILISACLIGCHSRYDGGTNLDPLLLRQLHRHPLLPVCPEQLGGLSTPRPACEIRGGNGHQVIAGCARVLSHDGQDWSGAFVKGARETLYLAELQGVRRAILKSKSPSCSPDTIYDGSFTGHLVDGMGVTAAMLEQHGVTLIAETNFSRIIDEV